MSLYNILKNILNIDLSKFTNSDIENICSEISKSELETAIEQWIRSERDRKVLRRRLIDGICYEPLADEMGMSVRRIKDIVSKAEACLFKHL